MGAVSLAKLDSGRRTVFRGRKTKKISFVICLTSTVGVIQGISPIGSDSFSQEKKRKIPKLKGGLSFSRVFFELEKIHSNVCWICCDETLVDSRLQWGVYKSTLQEQGIHKQTVFEVHRDYLRFEMSRLFVFRVSLATGARLLRKTV